MDTECVQATALKVVFDLLHTFGIDAFEVAGEVEPAQTEKGDKALNESGSSGSEEVQEDEEEGDKEEAAKIGNSLASILIKQLDNEVGVMCFSIYMYLFNYYYTFLGGGGGGGGGGRLVVLSLR